MLSSLQSKNVVSFFPEASCEAWFNDVNSSVFKSSSVAGSGGMVSSYSSTLPWIEGLERGRHSSGISFFIDTSALLCDWQKPYIYIHTHSQSFSLVCNMAHFKLICSAFLFHVLNTKYVWATISNFGKYAGQVKREKCFQCAVSCIKILVCVYARVLLLNYLDFYFFGWVFIQRYVAERVK